jgi:16S rRNA (adenine1518-N6/adenine1519-N6)-dimethyltransferase
LAQRVDRVIAIDIDQRCCRLLAERMAAWPGVAVVCQDVLSFSWRGLRQITVVGAIPYHLTSPILVMLSEAREAVDRVVLIIQEEVADRLRARPGTKAYGRLSVLAQFGWRIVPVLRVPRSAFFPQPRVDSWCLELVRPAAPPIVVQDEAVFFAVVKAAFAQRRKTLVNCLTAWPEPFGRRAAASSLTRKEATTVLGDVGLPMTVRGEALSLGQFAAVADRLAMR